MEMYPAQFPDEGHPDPSRRAEDSVFDVIQDSDRQSFVNHEEQPDPETPEVDFPLSLPGVGHFLLEIERFR